MKRKLSHKQQRILGFIGRFVDDNPFPPTIRDIQAGCDISSTSVVDYNLQILAREGHIHREAGVSRGIELLTGRPAGSRLNMVQVPVLGSIAAGEPLPIPRSDSWRTEAVENLDLPSFLTNGKPDVFAVRVKGESMIDAAGHRWRSGPLGAYKSAPKRRHGGGISDGPRRGDFETLPPGGGDGNPPAG